jgi:CRP-like cAMP-binding protein
VQIAGQEGVVTQVQWRSTVLRTTKNHCVTVPNSSVAKAEILNFSAPTKLEVRSLDIGIDFQTQPNTVKKIVLQAILATEGVKHEPAPECRLINFSQYTVTYRLWFWIDDFQNYGPIEERVMTNLWYYFKREGIVIPYPIQTLRMDTISRQQMLEDKNTKEIQAKALEALAGVDILKSLSRDELGYLAERVRTVMFGRGEVIVHQGDEGSEFYIIVNGRVQIIVEKDERVIFTADKEAGYFFGEMSLLTGQPRMATIRALADTEVIAIDKNAFDGVLRANPSIIDKLSETIEKRMQQVSASEDAINANKEEGNTLLVRIKRFFGIG